MDHDPKKNPQAGDVLMKGKPKGFVTRLVLGINGVGHVTYMTRNHTYAATLEQWRDWAVDAKIVKPKDPASAVGGTLKPPSTA